MYLDYSATTPLTKEVKEYITLMLDTYANPSATYENGHQVKLLINEARNNIAQFINADIENSDIIFTCGGSASNTLAIKGLDNNDHHIYYSPIAHKSIQECVKSCANAQALQVDKYGLIDINDMELMFKTMSKKPFVIVDYANSEIGTIQDVNRIIELTHQYGGIVYLDCTGTIPQLQIDVQQLDVDMLGFSAHKLGALKGTGVLYQKKNISLKPLIYGSQEGGIFGGTENVLGILALSKAVENYRYDYITSKNRDYVYEVITSNIPNTYMVGADVEHRLPNNLYMCFENVNGESLMILLDNMNIQVSTGSACTSGSPLPSTTLLAIGMDKKDIHSCIRMSFSGNETIDELDEMCKTLKTSVAMLRSIKE